MIKEWFKNYFNLAYVWGDNNDGFTSRHKRLKERTEEETEGIIKISGLKSGLILDAPCGYGRHSIGLASKGFSVIGIDINKFLLKIAKYRAKNGLDVYENRIYNSKLTKKLLFKNIDLRRFPDEFSNRFDCVINMFFSFGYFNESDNIKVLRNFHKALKRDGHLIISILSDEILKNTSYLAEHTRKVFPTKILGKLYPQTVLSYEKRYNSETRIFNSVWKIRINKDWEADMGQFPESRVRIYSMKEYKDMLKEAGFRNINFYKDWKKNKFDKKAEELIIHALK